MVFIGRTLKKAVNKLARGASYLNVIKRYQKRIEFIEDRLIDALKKQEHTDEETINRLKSILEKIKNVIEDMQELNRALEEEEHEWGTLTDLERKKITYLHYILRITGSFHDLERKLTKLSYDLKRFGTALKGLVAYLEKHKTKIKNKFKEFVAYLQVNPEEAARARRIIETADRKEIEKLWDIHLDKLQLLLKSAIAELEILRKDIDEKKLLDLIDILNQQEALLKKSIKRINDERSIINKIIKIEELIDKLERVAQREILYDEKLEAFIKNKVTELKMDLEKELVVMQRQG